MKNRNIIARTAKAPVVSSSIYPTPPSFLNQLFYASPLDERDIAKIRAYFSTISPQPATIGFDSSNHEDAQYRVSDIRWLDVSKIDISNRFIFDIIWDRVVDINKNFQFDISHGILEIQHTTYKGDLGGKYDWHHDIDWRDNRGIMRKLSVVINLSCPDDYDGGELTFDQELNNMVARKDQGSVIIFPSFFEHFVSTVTSGTRETLVSWIYGPPFK